MEKRCWGKPKRRIRRFRRKLHVSRSLRYTKKLRRFGRA